MARENNFLLGRGELLTKGVTVKGGGGSKNPPYTIEEARGNVTQWLNTADQEFKSLPSKARPKDQVVACITMHPRYTSKSDFPNELFSAVGLRALGSRTQSVTPRKWGVDKHPATALTETYFVAGKLESFEKWGRDLNNWGTNSSATEILTQIEDLKALRGIDKLKGKPSTDEATIYEFVLHNDHNADILEEFYAYAQEFNSVPIIDKRRDVRGLTFLPVRSSAAVIEKLAEFSFVRAARSMPTLRPFRPSMVRNINGFGIELPDINSLSHDVRAVIFDGGLPSPNPLERWVNYIEPAGIGLLVPNYVEHGLAVTSALLFGQLTKGQDLPQPFSQVDHVRVLDSLSGKNDCDIVDVLDRINAHLDTHQYEFVNISLGPDTCVDDDDVTLWTSALDERFAQGKVITTVAAGNNGDKDALSGLNRIQVPSDAVNVLSVGAASSLSAIWERAPYSAVGPGRCPGRAKPDIVAFGGSDNEPFMVLANNMRAIEQQGTSFSAPLALRSVVAVRSILGEDLSALALRALLIHRADRGTHNLKEVGWGRLNEDPMTLMTTEDDEAIIIFQGNLLVGEHLRAPVPLNNITLSGSITLGATLIISPEVDPEYPGSYTRSGVQVTFRPHDARFNTNKKNGKLSQHSIPHSFFSESKIFGGAEYESKDDGHKWEPTLRHFENFKAAKLSNPIFDIYYHHRLGGAKALDQKPIPYALVISVKAASMPDLYNQMVRAYASILTPIRPVNRIQIKP